MRRQLSVPEGRDVVGFLGLLADYQGVGDLLYAARRIVERRPQTHFLIMGYPGLEQYQRQAYDLQILDHVTFTGRVPYAQAPDYLSAADVAVSAKTSASEANGKLLNYMAMGLPAVAYETPVAREILGDLGLFAPPGDVAALAGAIERVLDDQQLRHELAGMLRARAERQFSWASFGHQLVQLYDRVCASSAGVPAARRWQVAPRAD